MKGTMLFGFAFALALGFHYVSRLAQPALDEPAPAVTLVVEGEASTEIQKLVAAL